MENWLEIAAGAYLLGMILYGHYRGFIKMAVSMAALVGTIAIVRVAMPPAAAFVKSRTPVYGWVLGKVESALVPEENPAGIFDELAVIENMDLPEELRKLLIENNNRSVYEALGVHVFTEYISNYLTDLIVNAVGFVVLFVFVYMAVHLVMHWADLMAKLPILSGMNKIAGALLGGFEGLLFLWLLSLLVTAFSGSGWAKAVIAQIESSRWLPWLYHNNIIWKMVLGLLRNML